MENNNRGGRGSDPPKSGWQGPIPPSRGIPPGGRGGRVAPRRTEAASSAPPSLSDAPSLVDWARYAAARRQGQEGLPPELGPLHHPPGGTDVPAGSWGGPAADRRESLLASLDSVLAQADDPGSAVSRETEVPHRRGRGREDDDDALLAPAPAPPSTQRRPPPPPPDPPAPQ